MPAARTADGHQRARAVATLAVPASRSGAAVIGRWRLGVFTDRSVHDGISDGLNLSPWLALVLAPVLAFVAAVAVLHRRERPARLLAIDGERRLPEDPRDSR